MTCPCDYPVLIDYKGIPFIAFPLEEFEQGEINIPDIEEDESGKWVIVKWKKNIHGNVKEYDVIGHIVLAGCEENELSCSKKDIYHVYHPIDEWNKEHMLKIK